MVHVNMIAVRTMTIKEAYKGRGGATLLNATMMNINVAWNR